MKISLDRNELMQLSKEELVDRLIEISVAYLDLLKRVEVLEAKLNIPKKDSKNSSQPPSKDQKSSVLEVKNKGGAKLGHEPHNRVRTKLPDKQIKIKIDICPNCGMRHEYKSDCYLHHQVIELKSLEIELIEILRQKSTCWLGDKSVLAPNLSGVMDDELFGPRLKSLILILHFENLMSINKIKSFINTFSKYKISKGAISKVINRCGKVFQSNYEDIINAIKLGQVIGIDETGWRVLGDNQYLWAFQNNENVVYKIDKSRGNQVVKDVIGEDYSGIIISDFYSAYGKVLSAGKQKCLAHLIRAIKYVDEVTGSLSESFSSKLINLFQKAIHLKNAISFECDDFILKRKAIEAKLDDIIAQKLSQKDEIRLCKRLIKYRKELFVFLYHKEVPPTNNSSEITLRPKVIHRKICHGSKSIEGKNTYCVLSSIIETSKRRKENVFDKLIQIFEEKNVVIPRHKLYFPAFNTS